MRELFTKPTRRQSIMRTEEIVSDAVVALSRLNQILFQLDAEREALLFSFPAPIVCDLQRSGEFFARLSSIAQRYRAIQDSCRRTRDAVREARLVLR